MLNLVDKIRNNLEHLNGRGSPLTPLQQTCLALTFYAGGTFQRVAGRIAGRNKQVYVFIKKYPINLLLLLSCLFSNLHT